MTLDRRDNTNRTNLAKNVIVASWRLIVAEPFSATPPTHRSFMNLDRKAEPDYEVPPC